MSHSDTDTVTFIIDCALTDWNRCFGTGTMSSKKVDGRWYRVS
jgi:hypothetical protein